VQAAIALEALKYLDDWTRQTVANAMLMNEALRGAAVRTPEVPSGSGHVYYQYAIYTDRRDQVIRRCIRRGIDVETLHVDVCTRLPLFGGGHAPAPGAERTAAAIQLPVHASMTAADLRRVAAVVRHAVGG
jgi:dTDP-4-amino-4,6-dideoxygalactose transaminase